jgi:hypothetical protein
MSLLADEYLTTPRVTPVSHQHVIFLTTVSRLPSNGNWPLLHRLGTDCTESTVSSSFPVVACVFVAAIALQRPLFTEPLGCFKAAYFVVVTQQRL